jgi:hypothetical protein
VLYLDQQNFVDVVRAVEFSLGIPISGINSPSPPGGGVPGAFGYTAERNIFNAEVKSVLEDSIPVIVQMALKFGISGVLEFFPKGMGESLYTACVAQ